MQQPTILHIDNSPVVTGAYKALLSWCTAATEFRHIWVLPAGSAVADEVRKQFVVYELPFVEIGRSAHKLLRYLPALWLNGRRLRKIVLKEQVQLIHANDLYNLTPYVGRIGLGKKLPIAVHARMLRRSFPGRIYDAWVNLHLKRASAIIAVSEAIKNDWRNDSRVKLVYDPIDIKERLPAYSFRKEPGEAFRFLYLANYISGKGQDDALKAVRLLKEKGVSDFHVSFYGGTMQLEKNEVYKSGLEQYAKEQGLSNLVSFQGPVQDVEAVMKAHHALLHFSRSESFGMVCYEGLYYGLPVISTDCGGPAEMMQPDVSGILLPVGAVEAYAEKMKALMEDPELCQQLSHNASLFVRNKFKDGAAELSAIFAGLIV